VSLLERRPRVGCVVASVILAPLLALGVTTVFGIVDPPNEIPEALAEAAFEREARESARIGMTVASDRTEELAPADTVRTERVRLDAGECVGITAAAWGYVTVRSVAIRDREDLVRGQQTFAIANAAQWCASAPRSLEVRVELSRADSLLDRDEYSSGHLRWQIARGRVDGAFSSLTRGVPTAAGARSLDRATYVAMSDRHARGTPIGPVIDIAPHRARLIPESVQVYDRFHALADNGRGDPVTPRWDPLPPDVPPAWRPLASGGATPIGRLTTNRQRGSSGAHPAIVFRDGDGHRALLAIRPSELGAGCVRLHLVRMMWGYHAGVERIDERRVERHRNIASDRLCASTTSVVTYVAPADDHATYLLRFFTD
jgi:hypothetical protein